jgi:16S rRNA processing protein RimM
VSVERIAIGRILATRGLKGELRVAPAGRDHGRFSKLERVYVGGDDQPAQGYRVRDSWQHKNAVILRLESIDSIEQAEPLVGRELLVPADEAIRLDPDEYFVHDLIGLAVVTDRQRELGVLEEVIAGSANDIYVVRGPHGELLVPAVGAVVLEIDLQARRMLIHDLPGLVDPETPL